MMSREQNDRITRVGPADPAGRLLRRYWQPVALLEEFDGQQSSARPVKAVRLLGEDFVLFRDEAGAWGLLDRDCPHRGADLAYGRREDGGLRCPFHGWLFDVTGRCLDTPAEPAGSRLCERIRQRALPVREAAGALWAWPGEGEPPPFPALDCFVAPDSHVFAFKGLWECNWLQSLEVGIDPAHASFLHRFFEDEVPGEQSYGRQFRSASGESELPMTRLLREHARPEISVEPTARGLQLLALRRIDPHTTHLRLTQHLFPQAFAIPLSEDMTIVQYHVPVDDHSNYWFAFFTSFGDAIDKERMRGQRLALHQMPDYRPRVGRANQYGFDAQEQVRQTFTGMGHDINVHDQWACESQGRIQDRTREHLGTTDRAIIAARRLLLKAIDALERDPASPLPGLDAGALAEPGPPTVDAIGPGGDIDALRSFALSLDARRRAVARHREQPA
jgi:phthalate 4,5-dioxygenase